MRFFEFKRRIYPIFTFLACIFILVFGLIEAKNIRCCYFLAGVYVWVLIFANTKKALKMFIPFVIVGGIFGLIAYFAYGNDIEACYSMINRFASVFICVALGRCVEPVDMTRCLSTLKMPRSITLGMLIATSFPPVLGAEIKRVKEAMKTRGAGSLNPKIIYRAFLVPFIMRLVNISDTLSLSVETRGFSLDRKVPYTVYKKEIVTLWDIIFMLGLAVGATLMVIL